ncbi:hypothetical protein D3C78_272160 [compost metagenome]
MKFNICIPSYKRESLLQVMINSISDDILVCISDNGDFYKKNRTFHGKANVFIHGCAPVIPMFSNWVRAASLSEEPFFFLPSDDDLYYQGLEVKVSKTVDSISDQDMSNVSMIVFGHNIIDEFGNVLSSWVPPVEGIFESKAAFEVFKFGVDARMPSILINKEKYQNVGGINTAFQLTAADSELIQKLALTGKVIFSKEIISAYRVWPGSLTHKKIASEEWSREIELWMSNIVPLLYAEKYSSSFIKEVTDEIRLRNIITGVSYADGIKSLIQFLFIKKYPRHAKMKTHMRLILQVLKKFIHK